VPVTYLRNLSFKFFSARPIPIINVRFSCSGCPKDQIIVDLGTDTDAKILSRINNIEKLLFNLLSSKSTRDKLAEGNPELQTLFQKIDFDAKSKGATDTNL
jgi:hypothetical protein